MASLEAGIGEVYFARADCAVGGRNSHAHGGACRSVRPARRYGSQKPRTIRPVSFTREIAGILTKRGCNGAACHGGVKGQGGLKLSANALYPADDYDWITKGGGYQVLTAEVKGERVPRIDLANPEKSLLLLKPTMAMPHGGGKRFEADSDDYKTILSWIRNGAPLQRRSGAAEPKLVAPGVVSFDGDPARGRQSIACWSPRTSAMATRKTTRTRRSTRRTTAKSRR